MAAAVVCALLASCVSSSYVEPGGAGAGAGGAGGAGANGGRSIAGKGGAPGKTITVDELDQLTKAYADRYSTLITAACDAVEKNNPSLEQRRAANLFKLTGVSSVYDIATNADPFTQLIDMMLVVTLQSGVWIDDGRADDTFGERAEMLIGPLRRAREDAWDIGKRVMTDEQLAVLDHLIWDWRRKNSDVEFVSFVRFDDFAASRGKSVISGVKAGGGFLAPVDAAKHAVDEARLFGERVFFMSKRAPFLLNWQARSLADELMIQPEIAGAVKGLDTIAASVDRVSRTAEALPGQLSAERAALLNDLETKSEAIRLTMSDYRDSVAQTDKLVASVQSLTQSVNGLLVEVQRTGESLNTTIDGVRSLMEPPPVPEGGVPPERFDIDDYTRAASELNSAVKELNTLLVSANTLVGSSAWPTRLGEVDQVTTRRLTQAGDEGARLVDRLFARSLVLACVVFGLMVVYKLFAVWMGRVSR